MLSIYDQGAAVPCPAPFNLAGYVLAGAGAHGDKAALRVIHGQDFEHWSYDHLRHSVLATAGGLLALGLQPGARILLRLGNTVDFPIAFLAAIAAGLVPVPTAAALTRPEIDRICADLCPALILAGDGIALPTAPPCPVLGPDALADLRRHAPADIRTGDPDRLGYIIYTSGTSGHPRGVAHTHRAIWARRMMHGGWTGLTAQDRILHAGAFNWTYTLGTGLLDPWSLGATALILHDPVAPPDLFALLARHRATIFAAVPGIYRQMLRTAPATALPDLRHGLSAGETLPESLRAARRATTGTDLHEAMGVTECSTFISGAPSQPAAKGSLGRPQPGRRIAVLDDAGQPCPIDTPGTLAIDRADPGLCLGYLSDDIAAQVSGDWFLTGDTVRMAADHSVTYLGRADDMMNAGGFRVSPLEVEAALMLHPGLREVAVAEVSVKPGTTVIAAFYVADTDIPDLAAHAARHLARYKQPRLCIRLPALPKGPNGKTLRRTLRDHYTPNPEALHDHA